MLMDQKELLEYLKEEMEFACELWADLPTDRKTLEFKNYLRVQITSTIFGQQATKEIIDQAHAYFSNLDFHTVNEVKEAI